MRGVILHMILVLTAMTVSSTMAAETLEGYGSRAEIVERMSRLPLVGIEGIWRFPATGQTIVIERDDRDAMRFRVVSGVSQAMAGIESGVLLGYIVPTAKNGTFDATLGEINSDGSARSAGVVSKNHVMRFTLDLSGSRMSFTPVKRGLKVNLWRLFPYMFRFSVRAYDDRRKGLDGCMRVWPRDLSEPPYQPRYL